MQEKLTSYEKYILNQIEIGELHNHKVCIVSHISKRINYYKAINHLKELGIIWEMSGELVINTDSNYYKSQIKNYFK